MILTSAAGSPSRLHVVIPSAIDRPFTTCELAYIPLYVLVVHMPFIFYRYLLFYDVYPILGVNPDWQKL